MCLIYLYSTNRFKITHCLFLSSSHRVSNCWYFLTKLNKMIWLCNHHNRAWIMLFWIILFSRNFILSYKKAKNTINPGLYLCNPLTDIMMISFCSCKHSSTSNTKSSRRNFNFYSKSQKQFYSGHLSRTSFIFSRGL